MVRPRNSSMASEESGIPSREQELGSMYDYLAKIILLGPSGCGKSCLLHRFVKNEWRTLSSQTIGVEFASKIIRIGTGARRKRIKLQLWDTAGTERFRSVSRSYYRGAAGAILVYDISSHSTFTGLPTFLNDARALASPNLSLLLVGNKNDLADAQSLIDFHTTPSSLSSQVSSFPFDSSASQSGSMSSKTGYGLGAQLKATMAPDGREVSVETASKWASTNSIPVSVEVSALNGQNVDEVFEKLAKIILTKIELGEIDPDDPQSGIQYGDGGRYADDGASMRSGVTSDGLGGSRRRKKGQGNGGAFIGGMREWEEVFTLGNNKRKNAGCC